MTYSIELTNGKTFWTKHVSADEIGEVSFSLFGTLISFCTKVLDCLRLNLMCCRGFSS